MNYYGIPSRGFYSVQYIHLLVDISVARANGTYRDYRKAPEREGAYFGRVVALPPSKRQRPGMCWNW